MSLLSPLVTLIFNGLSDSYHGYIYIDNSSAEIALKVNVTLLESVYIEKIPVAPAGYRLTAGTELVHNLVPLVLFVTGILCWPLPSWRDRGKLLLISIPLLVTLIALTIPTLLLGHVEAVLLNAAQKVADRELNQPFIMDWVVFIETGGRWVLPLVLIISGVSLVSASSQTTAKNRQQFAAG